MSIRSKPNVDIAGSLLASNRPGAGALRGIQIQSEGLEAVPEALGLDRLKMTTALEPKQELSELVARARGAKQGGGTAPEKTSEVPPPSSPFNRKSPAVQRQEEAIAKALGGQIVAFPTLDGGTPVLRISQDEKRSATEPLRSLRLTLEGASFDVTLDPGLDAPEMLAKVVEYFSKVPAHLRPSLKALHLDDAPNPQDAYWAQVYGKDGFTSAATAGGGKITLWNLKENPYNLNEGVFNHEMGHLIGAGYSTSKQRHAEMVPPGWEAAMQADAHRVSEYANHNPNEDFSETWRYYLEARRSPEALKAFQEKVPNRVRILEAIYKREFEGRFKVGLLDREILERETMRHA